MDKLFLPVSCATLPARAKELDSQGSHEIRDNIVTGSLMTAFASCERIQIITLQMHSFYQERIKTINTLLQLHFTSRCDLKTSIIQVYV